MGWLAALGGGAFVLASVVVSARLLALALRTRELPELLVGLNLALSGALGYPVAIYARVVHDPALRAALQILHGAMMVVGLTSVVIFNWRVFRPADAWARRLSIAYPAVLVALFAWQTAAPGWAEFAKHTSGPWRVLPYGTLFALGWAGIESLLYYQKLRKRLALGLAEAVTTDRLRLWAIAMLAAFMTSLLVQVVRSMGVAMTGSVTGLIVGPLGIVSASAMWLAFLPPQRYVDWVLARAGTARA